MDKTIIQGLFEYMSECELLNELADLNVDFLDDEDGQVSLEPTPAETVTQHFINGATERQYQFVLAITFSYSDEAKQTIDNSGFFEKLEEWFEEQTFKGALPDLGEGRTATSIEAVSSGYLYGIDENQRVARYQIQCVLYYSNNTTYIER